MTDTAEIEGYFKAKIEKAERDGTSVQVSRNDLGRILSALEEARERAEHAESFCYRAAKAAGQHEFVCAETVSLRAERDAAIRERDEAREACAKNLEDFRDSLKGWPNEALDALSRAARMLREFDPHGDSADET